MAKASGMPSAAKKISSTRRMSIDMGGPFNKAAYVFGTAALSSGNYEVMAAVMVLSLIHISKLWISSHVLSLEPSFTNSTRLFSLTRPCACLLYTSRCV